MHSIILPPGKASRIPRRGGVPRLDAGSSSRRRRSGRWLCSRGSAHALSRPFPLSTPGARRRRIDPWWRGFFVPFFSPSLARARWARGFHGAVGTGANSNAPACPGLVVCCAVAGFFSLSFPVASTLLPVLGSPAAPSKLHQHLPPPYPSRREIMRARGISARPTFLQRQRAL